MIFFSENMTGIVPGDYSNCLNFHEAAYQMMNKWDTEVNQYYRSLAEAEIVHFANYGVPMVYEAADISNMTRKAIDTMKSWLSKIMGVINRFIQEFKIAVSKIIKSFGQNMSKLKNSKKIKINEFEDYDYVKAKDALSETSMFNISNMSVMDENIQKVVSKWVDGGDEITVTNIVKHLRGEKKVTFSKDNVHGADAKWCYNTINNYQASINFLTNMQKEMKQRVDDNIKDLEVSEKDLIKQNQPDLAKSHREMIDAFMRINSYNAIYVSAAFTIVKGALSLATKMANGWIKGEIDNFKTAEDTSDKYTKDVAMDDFMQRMKNPNYTFKY